MLTLLAAAVIATQADVSAPITERATDPVVIRKAVRAALADERAPVGADIAVLSAKSNERFQRQVEDARVPDCLHADGLKRQPTFFFTQLLALPFVAVAKLRGKCS